MSNLYPGLFSAYDLKRYGSKWLRHLDEDLRKSFSGIGLIEQRKKGIDIHSVGCKARSKTAKRDKRGRFIK